LIYLSIRRALISSMNWVELVAPHTNTVKIRLMFEKFFFHVMEKEKQQALITYLVG
jgi:hypothetical protein